jgi:thiopurine S-methyltransferase
MDSSFWDDRWKQNQIGFHQKNVNPHLLEYAHLLPEGPLLVPLCGKSLDLWFLSQTHPTIGCEFIESAVEAFYQEAKIHPQQTKDGAHNRYDGGGVRIFAGDFFALSSAQTGPVSAIYDRAAMIALPPAMRQQYLEHLLSFLPKDGACLMIGLTHKGGDVDGPPFSIPFEEVVERLKGKASLQFLREADGLMGRPDLQQRGFASFREWVALLTK